MHRLPGRSQRVITCKAHGLGLKRHRPPARTPNQVREAKRLAMRLRRIQYPERVLELRRNYYAANRQLVLDRHNKWARRHFFRNRASRRCGASASELFGLWVRQRGLCALTGRKLDRTAHLDHIVPKARGGTDVIGNYRWVCPEVNMVKRDLMDDEFLRLCRDCMAWIGERIAAYEQRGRVGPTPAGTTGIAPAGDLDHGGDRHG